MADQMAEEQQKEASIKVESNNNSSIHVDNYATKISNLYLQCFNEKEQCINVIGGGNMAKALVQGFIKTGCFKKSNVFICTKSAKTAQQWNSGGFPSAFPQDQFYKNVKKPRGIVLIAVKPQAFPTFLDEVRANEWFYYGSPDLICISIMAGISLNNFGQKIKSVGFDGHSARLMPNVNCAVSAGTLVLSVDQQMPNESTELLITLGNSVGTCIKVEESQYNAAASVAACAPAFIAIVIEAISDGGVLSGLGRELSTQLAADMVKGTAQLFLASAANSAGSSNSQPFSPAQLKDQVCSPAGTTIAGLRELERKSVRSAFIEAIYASTQRAAELMQNEKI